MKFFQKSKPPVETPETFFGELPSWYAMVARNLSHQEIKPYADMFSGRQRLTVFDCGANRGVWTRAAIETFPSATIEAHLFEPSPKNCAFIRSRDHALLYSDKQFETIIVNECAVGAEAATLKLHTDWEGSWLASLVDRGDVKNAISYDVPVVSIDDYCKEKSIHEIDILKIDVEGYELKVLEGAENMLPHVSALLFEFSHANVYSRTFFLDFWNFLTPIGFKIALLDNTGGLTPPIAEYSGAWERFDGTCMFFANRA